jgi:hypothetical protein
MDAIQLNIKLPFEQLVEAVRNLSPKEKLLLNDAIWDEQMEIPTEQQEFVRNRIQEAKQNPESLLDWEEVKKDI